MKKLAIAAILMSALATIAAQSTAQPGFGHERGDFGRLEMMATMLGLSEEQEAEINELLNAAKLASAVDRERMQQIREELHRLAESAEGFDEGRAQQLADELGEIVTRTSLAGAETRWKVRQVFTDEQRLEMEAIKAERAQMRTMFGPGPRGQSQ